MFVENSHGIVRVCMSVRNRKAGFIPTVFLEMVVLELSQ